MLLWYLFNTSGFYQVTAGSPDYEIGNPILKKLTINVGDRKTFVILVKDVSGKNKYIQTAFLNGKP